MVNAPVKPAVVNVVLAEFTFIPTSCGMMQLPTGGTWVTVTVVDGGAQVPGLADGLVVWAVTVFASEPVVGLNVPVNPDDVQVVRALATVCPTRLGTLTFGAVHPLALKVTVTVAVATRQSFGLDAGVVVWVRTMSV
jgi:hypothetical protein